jgi:phage terminase small subunit
MGRVGLYVGQYSMQIGGVSGSILDAIQQAIMATPKKMAAKSKNSKPIGKTKTTRKSRKRNENGQLPDQQYFCDLLLADPHGNATKAYQTSHPNASLETATVNASKMLINTKVKVYLDKRKNEVIEGLKKKYEVSEDRIMEELAKIGFANMGEYVTWNGSQVLLIDSALLAEQQTAAVVEVSQSETKHGTNIRFKLADKKGPLELMGKKLGLFKEQVEHDVSDPLTQLIESIQEKRDVGPPNNNGTTTPA